MSKKCIIRISKGTAESTVLTKSSTYRLAWNTRTLHWIVIADLRMRWYFLQASQQRTFFWIITQLRRNKSLRRRSKYAT